MANSILDAIREGQSVLDTASAPTAPPISGDNSNTPISNDQPVQPYVPQAPGTRVYINTPGKNTAPQAVPDNLNAPVTGTVTGDVVGPPDANSGSPAAPTNTDDSINRALQVGEQALKEKGYTGYVPPLDTVNNSNDNQSKWAQAATDFGAGFNASLAKAISVPIAIVAKGMGLMGADYMQYGEITEHTKAVMNRMGIPTYEVENMANKLGDGALQALATWATMQAAAPIMAASKGTSSLSYLGKEVGQWAMKHPVMGALMGQAQSAGGTIANPHGDNPYKEMAGETLGGIAPGLGLMAAKLPFKLIPGVTPAIKGVGKLTGMGVNTLAGATLPTDLKNVVEKYNPLYQKPPQVPSTPLISRTYDPNRIQTFAKDQVYGAQSYQDKAVENALNSIPRGGDPRRIQARTHDLLLAAEKISKRIVKGFWDRVPLKTRISVNDLRNDVRKMRTELKDYDNSRPDEMMDKISSVSSPQKHPVTGQMVAARPTIAKLRDMQSQIGTAITEERAKDAPREGMIRNYVRLSEMIDDNIAAQLPNDTSIAQARNMSKRHNDIFSRGPINDILSKRRTGDFRVNPSDSIDTLMQKTDGLAALKAVQEGVSSYPRIPSTKFQTKAAMANPFAVTPADKAQLDQLVESATDSIRSTFRELADKNPENPKKAIAFSMKNEDEIKALGKVGGELAQAAQKVTDALAEKKAIQKSALARFAETDPSSAVSNIFSQKDPAQTAHQLMVTFNHDPDALAGLQNEVMDQFIYKYGKKNPNVLKEMMQSPRYGNLLETILNPEQLNRMKRMVEAAVHIGSDDMSDMQKWFERPLKTGARILGAMVGRKLETGTMQGPALMSAAAKRIMEKMLGSTDPSDLLSQAVLDPRWEQMLYSRIPSNTVEMRMAMRKYRLMFQSINTAYKETLNRLSKGGDPDAE